METPTSPSNCFYSLSEKSSTFYLFCFGLFYPSFSFFVSQCRFSFSIALYCEDNVIALCRVLYTYICRLHQCNKSFLQKNNLRGNFKSSCQRPPPLIFRLQQKFGEILQDVTFFQQCRRRFRFQTYMYSLTSNSEMRYRQKGISPMIHGDKTVLSPLGKICDLEFTHSEKCVKSYMFEAYVSHKFMYSMILTITSSTFG